MACNNYSRRSYDESGAGLMDRSCRVVSQRAQWLCSKDIVPLGGLSINIL